MTVETHDRRTMAETQLETALALYFKGEDYFSVITLAGAADEIFGQVLISEGGQSELDLLKKNAASVHKWLFGENCDVAWFANRANMARNALKHWHPNQPIMIDFDAEQEAKDMLDRAITNLWRLGGNPSEAATRFLKARLPIS
jgi:hypothetical protein